jgi:hypothetical protein
MDIEKAPSSCAKGTLESKVIGVFFNPWVAEFTTIIITIHFVMLPFDEISGVDYVPLKTSQMKTFIFFVTLVFQIHWKGTRACIYSNLSL